MAEKNTVETAATFTVTAEDYARLQRLKEEEARAAAAAQAALLKAVGDAGRALLTPTCQSIIETMMENVGPMSTSEIMESDEEHKISFVNKLRDSSLIVEVGRNGRTVNYRVNEQQVRNVILSVVPASMQRDLIPNLLPDVSDEPTEDVADDEDEFFDPDAE